MIEHLIPIPGPSLERLRLAYTNFEQLAVVISEALGLDNTVSCRVDLPRGAFVIVEDDTDTEAVGAGVSDHLMNGVQAR